jgi:hypothetical protein
MVSNPSPPPPPDPYATAAANQAGNVGTAIAQGWLNNPNQISPFGTQTTEQTGTYTVKDAQGNDIEVPHMTVTQSLSPEQQGLYDQQVGISDQAMTLGSELLGNINTDPVQLEELSGDYEQYRDRAEDTLRQRYQPEIDRQYEAERTRLANMGITLGSDAWNSGLDDANRARNDANLAIIGAAGSESDRAFAQDLARTNQNNEIRFTNNNQTLNQLSALLSQSQVTPPQFQGYQPGGIAPTSVGDYINKNYDQRLQGWQMSQNNRMAGLGAVGGLFGNFMTLPFGGLF